MWFWPPVNPRLRLERISLTQGKFASTISADSSAELLSNTMTSKGASPRTASRLAKQASRSPLVFQLHMVTLTFKSDIVAPGPDERCKQDEPGQQRQE